MVKPVSVLIFLFFKTQLFGYLRAYLYSVTNVSVFFWLSFITHFITWHSAFNFVVRCTVIYHNKGFENEDEFKSRYNNFKKNPNLHVCLYNYVVLTSLQIMILKSDRYTSGVTDRINKTYVHE